MSKIGSGDGYRLKLVSDFIEHLSKILETFCVWKFSQGFLGVLGS
jgi:hypothetical protein